MTERIFRSAIEALVGRSWSAPASWLSTAFFWPMTWLTIDRLMLIGTSSVIRRDQRGPLVGPVLERLADQLLGRRVDQDQEAALGLGEELHQGVDDLGRDGVDLQVAGEVPGDLEDRLELDLGLDGAGQRAGPRGVERVQGARGLVAAPSVTAISSESDRRLAGRVLGDVGEEDELDVADLDLVVGRQDGGGSSGSSFRPLRKVKFREWRSTRAKRSPALRISACLRLTPVESRMTWHSWSRPMTNGSALISMSWPAGSGLTFFRTAMRATP